MKPQLRNGPSILNRMRDAAYDTVFHVGDTGMQFVADLIRGPENARQPSYEKRQLGKQERSGEKPIKLEERQLFSELLKRHHGEPLTLYWKRRKAHLASPDKASLVGQFRELRAGRKRAEDSGSEVAAEMKKRQLEAEFRKITQLGANASNRMRARE